jgi:hypothetical protein
MNREKNKKAKLGTVTGDEIPHHTSSRFPCRPLEQDILRITIDHKHDDKVALLNCALVARNWVTASRHHMFHKLHIWGRYQVKDVALLCLIGFISLLGTPQLSSRMTY